MSHISELPVFLSDAGKLFFLKEKKLLNSLQLGGEYHADKNVK